MLRMPGEVAATIDLTSLPAEVAAFIERLQEQAKTDAQELARRDREIALARVKIDKLNFEVARLKRWKFDAKSEAMTAEQRQLFAEVMAEDEASLRAKLAELQRGLPETPKTPKAPPRKPRRQALPDHLEHVEHGHEPESTICPNADCGRPMQRIGEDVSEKRTSSRRSSSCTGTSTASGPASAASNCARSRPSRTWSTAASRLRAWWRTR